MTVKTDLDNGWSRRGLISCAVLLAGTAAAFAVPRPACAKDPIAVLAATGRPGIGTLEAIAGGVKVERDGVPLPVAQGDALIVGDTVLTEGTGRALLQLGNATQLRLGGDTQLRIDHFTPGGEAALTLRDGAMLYTRSARGQQPPLSVTAPFGEVAGRAGRLFVGRVEGQYGVALMRGSVKVEAGGDTLNLEPGDAVDIPRNGVMPAVRQPWSEARIRLALSLVE
ncbi:FecR domain-containing protein [Xanthobacter variabilis]|uniref:FecR domain-containing protein n=1 Tax=Xanthobacter variabilis TaxID=3119932 RepID=UPI0037277B0B